MSIIFAVDAAQKHDTAECPISRSPPPWEGSLVCTRLLFQMPMMKTRDLNTKIIAKSRKVPATANLGLVARNWQLASPGAEGASGNH
jgi:hypothetical protein